MVLYISYLLDRGRSEGKLSASCKKGRGLNRQNDWRNSAYENWCEFSFHADSAVPNKFFFSIQMNTMLSFHEECQCCPCPEDIQDLMWEFHQDLMTHCGR